MISTIIPTLNNAHTLPKILKSIMRSHVEKEVIVVDGGSSDGTKEVAKRYGCRVFDEEPHQELGCSVANAKNQGAKEAKGEILMFLEGDLDHLSEGFLEKVERTFEEGADAVSCRSELVEDSFWERLHDRFHRLNLTMLNKEQSQLLIAVRREVFNEVGGVPLIGYGEDELFDRKVRKLISVKLLDVTSYYHKVHSLKEMLAQASWVGRTSSTLRRSFLFGGLLLCLLTTLAGIMVLPVALLSSTGLPWWTMTLIGVLVAFYSVRLGYAIMATVKEKDAIFIITPLADLLYGVGYFSGMIRRGRRLGR